MPDWKTSITVLKHYLFNFDYTESSNSLWTCSRKRGCWRSLIIPGGGNRRTRGIPPTLDRRPLPCHMPTPGFDPGLQRLQASALTTSLSRHCAITYLKSICEHDSKHHAENCWCHGTTLFVLVSLLKWF